MRKVQYKDIEKLIIIIFFCADFFQNYLLTTDILWLSNVFKYIGMLLSIFYWITYSSHGIAIRTFGIQIIFGISLLYTSITSDNFSYFIVFCMIMTAKKLSMHEYIEYVMKCQIIEVITVVSIWCLSRVIDLGVPFYYNIDEQRISFGFGHPNFFAMKIIWCCFSYLFLSSNKIKKYKIFVIVLVEFIGFYCTKSNSFIFGILVIILFIFRQRSEIKNIINYCAKFIFPMTGMFVFLMAYFRDKFNPVFLVDLSRLVDVLSNFRISMASLALKNNGLTWFGSTVNYEHQWDEMFRFGNFTIDIIYIYFFVSIGIIYFVAISLCFFKLTKTEDYMISLSIILFSLCGLAELSILYITTCFVLMFIKVIIFKNEQLKDLF